MSYPLLPSVSLMEGASTFASDIIDTQPNLLAFLTVYLNGGTNPYNGAKFPGFFTLTNANLYGGDWSAVWGPCVYASESLGTATNAMYVAFSPSKNTYVVCIAGTNPFSAFDWIYEDADIWPFYMAQWPPKLPFVPYLSSPPIPVTVPAVSAATAAGISDLLTQAQMRDPNLGYLAQFLRARRDANATLIFAGHSLAGALAPALAFYLYPTPQTSGWKNIYVLPLAGATPGNYGFRGAFATAYPQTADSTGDWFWNIDYANHYDVVPHGWDKLPQVVQDEDSAGNFPSIWGVLQGPGIETVGYSVSSAMGFGAFLADGYYSAIPQSWVMPPWGHFTGQGTPTWSPLPTYTDASPLSTWSELAAVIVATHTDQYFKYFGVEPPPPIYKPELKTVSPEAAVLGRLRATRPRRRTGGPKAALTGRRTPVTS
jgi:hypothetical protein